jgi:hypothetical protein
MFMHRCAWATVLICRSASVPEAYEPIPHGFTTSLARVPSSVRTSAARSSAWLAHRSLISSDSQPRSQWQWASKFLLPGSEPVQQPA